MLNNIWYLILVPGIPVLALLVWMKWTFHKRDKRYRRPFEEMPRPAGWSLNSRMQDLMDGFTMNFMVAFMIGAVAWALSASEQVSAAVTLTLGLVVSSVFFWRSAFYIRSYSNHRLGMLGEQVVGRILDQLSSDSVRVFHDMEIQRPGKKPWNIDHVVLTPAGIFAIETKSRRKPRGSAPDGQQGHKVIFDGQQLRFPAPMKADRHGIEQARRNAEWLAGELTGLNGTSIPVTPVLVLPGWWIEAKGKGGVSVLNPKQLPGYLTGRAPMMPNDRQRAIATQLERLSRVDLSLPA